MKVRATEGVVQATRPAEAESRPTTDTYMPIEHRALLRFMILYSALFSAFGLASPFLPAFLAGRGLDSEQVGFVLGLATALRLVCGPIAGRLADRLQAFRAEIAVCAILAASGALLYLLVHGFWAVLAIGLLQAAVLAPLVPLAALLGRALINCDCSGNR
jgi:MFS transporter, PPP family, 3-phenylpropionic acid transporter